MEISRVRKKRRFVVKLVFFIWQWYFFWCNCDFNHRRTGVKLVPLAGIEPGVPSYFFINFFLLSARRYTDTVISLE